MPDLKEIRKELRKLLVEGVRGGSDSKKFIPDGSLGEVLTWKKIGEILLHLSPSIAIESSSGLFEHIFESALKVLGILILIEREELFFECFFNRRLYDNKLPIGIEGLRHLGDKHTIAEFHEMQYAFVAPTGILTDSAIPPLDKHHILPFLGNEAVFGGEGGFGKVYKMRIHEKHRGGPARGIYFARKEFKQDRAKDEASFKAEKEALETLRELKHKNIVQLLATYTHNGVYNMIFPLAHHNLRDHFEDKEASPKSPRERIAFLQKFGGVAEALDCIHNFKHQKNGELLEKHGYHHDLKPENILFCDGEFLIADFGLARFKDLSESSKTIWKMGTQSYGPPGISSGARIGRQYDIWSFGCILSEVLTFAIWGSRGIEEFREQRLAHKTSSVKNDCFHDGNKIKPEVLAWFDKLEDKFRRLEPLNPSDSALRPTLKLVREMLVPDVRGGPLSGDVASRFLEALRLADHYLSYPTPTPLFSPSPPNMPHTLYLSPPESHRPSLPSPLSSGYSPPYPPTPRTPETRLHTYHEPPQYRTTPAGYQPNPPQAVPSTNSPYPINLSLGTSSPNTPRVDAQPIHRSNLPRHYTPAHQPSPPQGCPYPVDEFQTAPSTPQYIQMYRQPTYDSPHPSNSDTVHTQPIYDSPNPQNPPSTYAGSTYGPPHPSAYPQPIYGSPSPLSPPNVYTQHTYHPPHTPRPPGAYPQSAYGSPHPPHPPHLPSTYTPPGAYTQPYDSPHTPHPSSAYPQSTYDSPPPGMYAQPANNHPHPQNPPGGHTQNTYGPPQNQNQYEAYTYSSPPPLNQPTAYSQLSYDPQYPPNPPSTYTQPIYGSELPPLLCQDCERLADRCPEHGPKKFYVPTPGCQGCVMLKDFCRVHGTGIR